VEVMLLSFQELIKEISVRAWNSPCRRDGGKQSNLQGSRMQQEDNFICHSVRKPFIRKPDRLINHFGLNHLSLPHPDILTTGELARMVIALTELWVAWNIIPEFPVEIPVKLKYTLLRDYLDRELPIPANGFIHICFHRIGKPKGEAA
jgi:hypothetical protein